MKTINLVDLTADDRLGCVRTSVANGLITLWYEDDDIPEIEDAPDPDAALRAQFEAEQAAKAAAEFDQFKARSGAPTYKSAAVKIAAEKLGLLAAIEAAIMALVDKASDKALYVWWVETDTISRGDAQWIEIEPAVSWGKSSADDLFALAAQV